MIIFFVNILGCHSTFIIVFHFFALGWQVLNIRKSDNFYIQLHPTFWYSCVLVINVFFTYLGFDSTYLSLFNLYFDLGVRNISFQSSHNYIQLHSICCYFCVLVIDVFCQYLRFWLYIYHCFLFLDYRVTNIRYHKMRHNFIYLHSICLYSHVLVIKLFYFYFFLIYFANPIIYFYFSGCNKTLIQYQKNRHN